MNGFVTLSPRRFWREGETEMASLHPSVFRHAASAERMRALIQKRGVVGDGRHLWTAAEDATIKRRYPDYIALRLELPQRTYYALRNRARFLGVTPRRKRWTMREIAQVRRLHSEGATVTETARQIGATRHQILGVRKRFKIGGVKLIDFRNPLLDAIRKRAKALNLTLRDLDREIGARRHFYFGKAQQGHINMKFIGRAVAVLGGHLSVNWQD